jgi:hypothetical protein
MKILSTVAPRRPRARLPRDRRGAELGRGGAGELALERAHRGAGVGEDDDRDRRVWLMLVLPLVDSREAESRRPRGRERVGGSSDPSLRAG